MRVLYVGSGSGTCLSRLRSLRRLESDVHFLDTDPAPETLGRIGRFLGRSLFVGPSHRRRNRDFVARVNEFEPHVVWVDKSVWVWPATLRHARRRGAFLVHHFTDAIHPRHAATWWSFHLLRRSLPLYDLNFTTNIDDVEHLRRRGVTVELTHLAYDSDRFDAQPLSPAEADAWSRDVVFIGHQEPRTERFMRALLDAGQPLTVFGWGWGRSELARRYPAAVRDGQISDEDYIRAIKGARIALCCVSEMNYNQTAARSYEIPACGTFLLAMRTPQHVESYREGQEAEFFSTPAELVDKVRRYLADEPLRKRVALAGWRRCSGDDYSWNRYMRTDWGKVLERLAARGSG